MNGDDAAPIDGLPGTRVNGQEARIDERAESSVDEHDTFPAYEHGPEGAYVLPRWLGWTIAIVLVAVWAVVRIVAFRNELFPLTYVLPLLLCVWTRSRRMLWAMGIMFVGLAILELLVVRSDVLPLDQRLTALAATLVNIGVGVTVVYLVILFRERFERTLADVTVANEQITEQYQEIETQAEELAQQNEELAQQTEELSDQKERLSRQAGQVEAQNEALRTQAGEVQVLNLELHRREALLQTLLEATRLQSSEEEVLSDVAHAAVTILGDGAGMAVLAERRDGRLVLLAAAGEEAETAPELEGFVPGAPSFEELVLQLGRTAAVNDVSLRPDLTLLRPAQDGPFGAALCAPFRPEAQASGLLAVYSREPFEWTAEQFRLAEWLASQCGRALDALRYQRALHEREEQQRRIAITLQANFIHPLPSVDGLEMAVMEDTAADLELVGGDFHDVFELPDGTVAVIIGDVEGKGVRAAGLSETVRSAVRALTMISPSARYVLNQVNRVLLGEHSEQFVTALLLLIERDAGRVTAASAGHPAPLLLREGAAAPLELSFGPPLGTFDWDYDQSAFTLRPGDVLVAFSDGLTEARRGGVLFGEEGVVEVLQAMPEEDPGAIVRTLFNATLEFAGRRQDDVQVLAMRYAGVSQTAGDDGQRVLQLTVPYAPAHLVDIRGSVRDFLVHHEVDEDAADDVVLCVEEACTNTLLHSGSASPAQLRVVVGRQSVEASVSDDGVGLPSRAVRDAQLPEPLAPGGRGLFLIRSIAQDVRLEGDRGTRIVMTIPRSLQPEVGAAMADEETLKEA